MKFYARISGSNILLFESMGVKLMIISLIFKHKRKIILTLQFQFLTPN